MGGKNQQQQPKAISILSMFKVEFYINCFCQPSKMACLCTWAPMCIFKLKALPMHFILQAQLFERSSEIITTCTVLSNLKWWSTAQITLSYSDTNYPFYYLHDFQVKCHTTATRRCGLCSENQDLLVPPLL